MTPAELLAELRVILRRNALDNPPKDDDSAFDIERERKWNLL